MPLFFWQGSLMQLQKSLFRALTLRQLSPHRNFRTTTFTAPFKSPRKVHADNGHTSSTVPHEVTCVQMIRNCTINGHVSLGEQLHCYVLRSGFASNLYVSSALVSFYAKIVSLDDAHKLFDEMPLPNVVSWNTLISGYVRSGKLRKALSFFIELDKSDVLPDAYSFASAIAACGLSNLLQLGMSLHSRVIVCGHDSSVVVENCLIDMYGKCSLVEGSIGVFDGLIDKDVISWNSVIAACARNQRLELAFEYFRRMPCPDTVTYNELINGVSKFGVIEHAIEILRSMPEPNSSSWNAIVSGYVVRNRAGEALDFFSEMHVNGVVMDDFTFSSILSGIASVSALRWGALIHACTIKHGLASSTFIGSALIDMYSKCGQVKDAEMIFWRLPEKNIVTWNALISGLAHNGEPHKVILYFQELKGTNGLEADDITFVNVLAACSQNQSTPETANEYLMSMINDYGIKPTPEHLASVIHLMGHYGELCNAEKLIHDLGFGSCASVWRALLGACAACADLEIAEVATTKLTQLVNHDETGYVILSNVHKVCENWTDATAVWDLMRKRGVAKGAGFSWVEG